MKNLKTFIVTAAAVAMVTSAKAQFYTANDLLLGIRTDTAANDLVINLGNANTSVGANGSLGLVVNLSSFLVSGDLTTFGPAFQLGVVGGQPLTAGRDLYTTVLRNSLGTPGIAGSIAPSSISSSTMGAGVGDLGQLANDNSLSAGTKITVGRTTASSFSTLIAPGTGSAGQYINDTGLNPMGTASGSVVREDLYRAVPNGQFSYLGYFTLDNSGASPLFTFTAVPEPSTASVLAVGGLVALLVARRSNNRKLAQPALR